MKAFAEDPMTMIFSIILFLIVMTALFFVATVVFKRGALIEVKESSMFLLFIPSLKRLFDERT